MANATIGKRLPTIVHWAGFRIQESEIHDFAVEEPINGRIWVTDFNNQGVVTVEVTPSSWNIKDLIKVLAGCFAEGSNFIEKVRKAFGYDNRTQFTVIYSVIDGVHLAVTSVNAADPDKLYKIWLEMKAEAEKKTEIC